MQHNILRFYISMYDSLRMYLVDSLADLFHDRSYLNFGHGLATPELTIQLTTSGDFHDDINICLVVEETVHFNYVWMI